VFYVNLDQRHAVFLGFSSSLGIIHAQVSYRLDVLLRYLLWFCMFFLIFVAN